MSNIINRYPTKVHPPRTILPTKWQKTIQKPVFGILHNVPIIRPTHIFEREWDTHILLDGCRVDALQLFEDEYSFLSNINSIYSVGSSSHSWMEETFSRKYRDILKSTSYITGNVNSKEYAPLERSFGYLDEVWKYKWNQDHGTVLAESITDRAIKVCRERHPEKLLIHYMQPHFPSVSDPLSYQNQIFDETSRSIWEMLSEDEIDKVRVWKSYIENLKYVLDQVQVLLNNIDSDQVVISADHSNLFGEWNIYGHPYNIPAPKLRRVPWVVTSASDSGRYEPTIKKPSSTESSERDVDSMLKDLGYK